MESQVFFPELRLRAQRQVDLQVAVLHSLGGKVALCFGQHGRQRDALRHGLLMVAAEDRFTGAETLQQDVCITTDVVQHLS